MAQSTAPVPPAITTVHTPAASAVAEPISPVSTPTTSGIAAFASATQQFPKPLSPRKRRRSPDLPVAPSVATGRRRSSSPVSPKTSALPPPPVLTAAAEMMEREKRRKIDADSAQARVTSENPQVKAVEALIHGGQSRPQDAPSNPATEKVSAPLAAMAPAISIPEKGQGFGNQQPSPASTKSVSTVESIGASTVTANGPRVTSPGHVGDEEERSKEGAQDSDTEKPNGESIPNRSMTYPGPLLSAQIQSQDPKGRVMSLPGSSTTGDDSKSPGSNKKHKCPYCATEFTRHHNLKSHLLTHSHEKPYLCQTCDSRFRRLHDLKRHTKLHTGERPHVCPKCNRSFARGDALARHNKGQGGCAGRRSSAGDFGEQGDESMDGLMYTTGDPSQEPETMDEDGDGSSRRDSNLPSIRHPEAHNQYLQPEPQGPHQRQPSTYPPVAARGPINSNLYPPAAQHATSGGPASPSSAAPHMTFPPSTAYSSNVPYGQGMTESPKPLSPGNAHPLSVGDPRNRSPSLTTQLANAAYPRRQSTRATPPPTLPPPHSPAPTLPPPHIPLNPTDARYGQSSSPNGPLPPSNPLQPQGGSYPGPPSGGSNSLSSHGTAPHNSGDRGIFSSEERLWAVIRNLESKVESLQGEVTRLSSQLAQYQQQQPPQPIPASQAPRQNAAR